MKILLVVLAIICFSFVYNIKLKEKNTNRNKDELDDDFKDTIKFAENIFTQKGIIVFLINFY